MNKAIIKNCNVNPLKELGFNNSRYKILTDEELKKSKKFIDD